MSHDSLSPYLSICVTTLCIIAPTTSMAELCSPFHMLQAVCSSPFLPSREGPLSLSRLWRHGFVCLFEVSCCRDGPMPSVPTAGSLQRASGLPWQQTFKTSSRLGSGSQLKRVCGTSGCSCGSTNCFGCLYGSHPPWGYLPSPQLIPSLGFTTTQ